MAAIASRVFRGRSISRVAGRSVLPESTCERRRWGAEVKPAEEMYRNELRIIGERFAYHAGTRNAWTGTGITTPGLAKRTTESVLMNFQKGLPASEIQGDYRGPYGVGRPAHGSDPQAAYRFGEDWVRPQLPAKGAHVTVQDLQYELQIQDQHRACLKISVASADGDFAFELTFPLEGQTGQVDVTLRQAQARLIAFIETVLTRLKSQPLQLG